MLNQAGFFSSGGAASHCAVSGCQRPTVRTVVASSAHSAAPLKATQSVPYAAAAAATFTDDMEPTQKGSAPRAVGINADPLDGAFVESEVRKVARAYRTQPSWSAAAMRSAAPSLSRSAAAPRHIRSFDHPPPDLVHSQVLSTEPGE